MRRSRAYVTFEAASAVARTTALEAAQLTRVDLDTRVVSDRTDFGLHLLLVLAPIVSKSEARRARFEVGGAEGRSRVGDPGLADGGCFLASVPSHGATTFNPLRETAACAGLTSHGGPSPLSRVGRPYSMRAGMRPARRRLRTIVPT